MAASPQWKVYAADGEYRAACKYVQDAGPLLAALGNGATLRSGHNKRDTVWTEGQDGLAAESYDEVARIATFRRDLISHNLKALGVLHD